MNRLVALKDMLDKGEITKADFIEKMFEVHQTLFQYSEFMRSTEVSKIEITGDRVISTISDFNLKMICNPKDHRLVSLEALNFGEYEKEERDMILRLVCDGDTVFDIGANIGWYSMMIEKAKKDVSIFAFEPVPGTYQSLNNHLDLNGCTRIQTFRLGFGEKEGELTFYFYPEGSVNASSKNLSGRDSVQEVKCQVVTMDNFVKDNGCHVDFIKCDVEGAELLVYQGGIETLAEHKPVVFTEMLRKWSAEFGYHPNDIIKLFSEIGYNCYAIEGDKLKTFSQMDENTLETNFFFLHPEKHRARMPGLV